jgi:hypothetical protein
MIARGHVIGARSLFEGQILFKGVRVHFMKR